MKTQTGAQVLVEQIAARGVKHIYGVPGGDCSLDVIAAAAEVGIRFVLTATENSAAMMACAEAEMTGTLGVVLTTRGPGVANAANGIAYAQLDRVPLLLIGDAYENNLSFVSHQRFDQVALLEPVTKGSLRLDDATSLPAIGPLLDLALTGQQGAVYIEMTGASMRGTVAANSIPVQPNVPATVKPSAQSLEAARELLASASRPVIIIGLQCKDAGVTQAVRDLAKRLGCPVFSTYKAKGVVPDADPLLTGYYISGAAEEETLRMADLVVMFGADPVEFPPQPYKYPNTPVLEFTTTPFPRSYFNPVLSVVGDLETAAEGVKSSAKPGKWTSSELASAKDRMLTRAQAMEGGPISPQLLVEMSCAALPANGRVTVDAGVHMLSVVAFFKAREPRDMLISRGLATMGFALPSAIGMAVSDPSRHVLALTGDGGLMMCVAELATAVKLGCKLTVVVFNDAAITMIGLKQRSRQLPPLGMEYSPIDFATVAEGFGCAHFRATNESELKTALDSAFKSPGVSLVDAAINPASYYQQLRSLRG
ncbi:MAG TPA: thiamine pyrophosphate-binding protein [Ramlibacter sp.]|nr:thiamine pyrophosphate-binding protein [Ramlibacter sp.]